MNAKSDSLSLKISWISLVVNFSLFLIKFVVGFLSNSISILTDAVNSFGDLFTTGILIVSLRLSRKPPDKEHPFGHGRSQDIGGLILSVILALVGLNYLQGAFARLFNPQTVTIKIIFMSIMFFSAVCKLILGFVTQNIGRKISSQILKTFAFDHFSDSVVSFTVGAGLILIKKNFVFLDSFIGIFISLLIIIGAFKNGRIFSDNLLGRNVSADFYKKIEDIVISFKLVKGVHGIEVHSYGDNRIISLHIEMQPFLSLKQAHEVADSIEKKIREEKLGRCTVHVDLKK